MEMLKLSKNRYRCGTLVATLNFNGLLPLKEEGSFVTHKLCCYYINNTQNDQLILIILVV